MARRFAKVSEEEMVVINEGSFFYPSDLVNTKTTSPLRVGEERWIYTSMFRVSVYTLRRVVVYHYILHIMCGYQRDKALTKNDTSDATWYHFSRMK